MKKIMIIQLLIFFVFASTEGNTQDKIQLKDNKINSFSGMKEEATFAGGCFWCMQAPFESVDGVLKVTAGYSGGKKPNPTYEEVSTGTTGYQESVQIIFDPAIISYSEFLDVYWKQFDPTDKGGSFYDRGTQYESVIFYRSEKQKIAAEKSKQRLNNSGIFDEPIVTKIEKFTSFYPAEKYHQDYYKKNPIQYESYKKGSGREAFIRGVWGDNVDKFIKTAANFSKDKLTTLQFNVTQKGVTETPFKNKYWNNFDPGIYVDLISGSPLFSSKDKYKSGTGLPSFTQVIDPRYVSKIISNSAGKKRIEVKGKFSEAHLGYLY